MVEKYRKTSSTSSHAMTTRKCEYCDSIFEVRISTPGTPKRFCSAKCASRKRNHVPKQCVHCGKDFPGRHNKFCSRKCFKQFNKTHMRDYDIAYRLGRYFQITTIEYNNLLLRQDGRCAICRKQETSRTKNSIRRLSVDHCHETNQVRGLLCKRCNLAIGQFEDNWMLLDNAIEYLSYWHGKHNSSKTTIFQESPILN